MGLPRSSIPNIPILQQSYIITYVLKYLLDNLDKFNDIIAEINKIAG
jgi:hypothetical protein